MGVGAGTECNRRKGMSHNVNVGVDVSSGKCE